MQWEHMSARDLPPVTVVNSLFRGSGLFHLCGEVSLLVNNADVSNGTPCFCVTGASMPIKMLAVLQLLPTTACCMMVVVGRICITADVWPGIYAVMRHIHGMPLLTSAQKCRDVLLQRDDLSEVAASHAIMMTHQAISRLGLCW